MPNLISRPPYLDELFRFRDTDLVKVVTGIRRCGKSSLLQMAAEQLQSEGVDGSCIVQMNLESRTYRDVTDDDLYELVVSRASKDRRTYVFIDEIQRILGWQDVINSLRVDLDCDIYLTGSNAYLMSSELSTYLSGRYVEVKMLPLSFREYLDFRGMQWTADDLGVAAITMDAFSRPYAIDDLFAQYRRYGGFPALATEAPNDADHKAYLSTLYESVVKRDILERERDGEHRTYTNRELLERLLLFAADNVSNLTSPNRITGALASEKLVSTNKTVEQYLQALVDAYIFYPVRRYDIKGKEYLKTLGKYYIVDPGLRTYLIDYRSGDTGHVLENIVYLQLVRLGFSVAIGKTRGGEIDFVATKGDDTVYLQVSETLKRRSTGVREMGAYEGLDELRGVRDSFAKLIVTGDRDVAAPVDGIRIINVIDFLLTYAG